MEVLLEVGADIHALSTGERGFTPLLFAVRAGALDATRVLLAAGADVNETFDGGPSTGMSALVLAVVNAHYDLAVSLLDHGADPNAAGQGWTALHQVHGCGDPTRATTIRFRYRTAHWTASPSSSGCSRTARIRTHG